jgi:hypothetical protein
MLVHASNPSTCQAGGLQFRGLEYKVIFPHPQKTDMNSECQKVKLEEQYLKKK